MFDGSVQAARGLDRIARLLEPCREPVSGRGHDRTAMAPDHRPYQAMMLAEDHRPRGIPCARHQAGRVDDVGEHHRSHAAGWHAELTNDRGEPLALQPGQQRRSQSVERLQCFAPTIKVGLPTASTGEFVPRSIDVRDRLLEHGARHHRSFMGPLDPQVRRAVAELDRRGSHPERDAGRPVVAHPNPELVHRFEQAKQVVDDLEIAGEHSCLELGHMEPDVAKRQSVSWRGPTWSNLLQRNLDAVEHRHGDELGEREIHLMLAADLPQRSDTYLVASHGTAPDSRRQRAEKRVARIRSTSTENRRLRIAVGVGEASESGGSH